MQNYFITICSYREFPENLGMFAGGTQMNQTTLARAVVPVLQGRQGDLFRLGCHMDFNLMFI